MSSRRLVLLLGAALPACTTLGPMPSTTGVSAIPTNRPGVELQAGAMPGYHLSDTAHDVDDATVGTQQIAALVEPDRILGTKGLILGARSFGDEGDKPFEPMIGLRRKVDDNVAVAGIAYGTVAHGGDDGGASYRAFRMGGELAIDATLIPIASWLALHVHGAVAATYLDATGTYCVDSVGDGTDCDQHTRHVDAAIEGVYGTATAGVALDIGRRDHGTLHAIRIDMLGSYGAMPRVRDGVQEQSSDRFHSIGLTLSVGFGADR